MSKVWLRAVELLVGVIALAWFVCTLQWLRRDKRGAYEWNHSNFPSDMSALNTQFSEYLAEGEDEFGCPTTEPSEQMKLESRKRQWYESD